MDKKGVLGFILIALVLMVWMWFNTPPPHPQTHRDSTAVASPVQDSIRKKEPVSATPEVPASQRELQPAEGLGQFFSSHGKGAEKILTIQTDLYTAEITTKGGLIRRWELKNYKTWNQYPVQLVDLDGGGDFSLLFLSRDGKQINTRNVYFEGDFSAGKTVTLSGDNSISVDLVLALQDNKKIIKRLTFTNQKYTFDAEIIFQNTQDIISGFEYQILWEHPLPYAEHNSIDESNFAKSYAYSGGEVADIDATKEGEPVQRDINGSTDWVAMRNKYFAVAMLPTPGASQGAIIEGKRKAQPDKGEKESYSIALKMPRKEVSLESSKITVFLGPLDFSLIKSMDRGLDHMMSLGAAWVIRPITEYIMLPLFNFLHMFISNWGIVIIIFSIIIKVALYPLTKSSMGSMKKMQKLQPLMNEIREKHKDNPDQMNKSIMNLYKEYGVNPAGGCLPLLLQMPILYALYNVFASSIQLRQANFFGWIHDLSIPDTIVHLPFSVPFVGMNQLSGLALAMCITMFIQQKQTVTDPRQKAMVWMMPVMMMLIFNNLPSGLNLYYFVFNLLSIGQQMWINKQHGDEPLRKVDPKKAQSGIMGRLTKNLPDLNKR